MYTKFGYIFELKKILNFVGGLNKAYLLHIYTEHFHAIES